MLKFFKTKVGFTLVELLVVVLIIGILVAIGIPVYQGFAKKNRVKLCAVQRREILAELRAWSNDQEFNQDYSFTITSDGINGTIVADEVTRQVKVNGQTQTETLINADIIENDILDGEIAFCPSSGTISVNCKGRKAALVLIEITCDGGEDGDTHNY